MKYLKIPVIIVFIISAIFAACVSPQESDIVDHLEIKHINWLKGVWKLENQDVFESWKVDDKSMSGLSYIISDQDTMIVEYLSIESRDDTLYYIPTVINQNEGKPIPFKSVKNHMKKLRFENLEHDFPKAIEYNLMGNDSIKVVLEGTPDQKREFFLLRYE